MSVDLVFSSKGAAQVLSDQQRLRDDAKRTQQEVREASRQQARQIADIGRAYRSTQTDVEKLQATADKLRRAVADTKLPDADRAKASESLGRIEQKIKGIKDQTQETRDTFDKTFGNAATGLLDNFTTVAGATAAAVGLVIKTVVDEMRVAQELADRSARTQVSVSASRDLALANAGSLTAAQKAQIGSGKIAGGIARDAGVSETIINQAIAAGLSSSGGDLERTVDATRVVARQLASRPSEIPEAVGALLGMSKFTGTSDALANQGLVSAIGGQSNIVSSRQQARNIPSALIGAASFGLDKSAPALFASLSNASNDFEGSQTKTALIRLAEQIEKYDADGQLAGLSSEEKLARLLADPELGSKFAQKLSLDAQLKGPATELFRGGDSKARRELAKARNVLSTSLPALRARGQQAIDDLALNTLQGRSRVSRGIAAAVQQSELSAPQHFLSDEDIAGVRKLILGSGDSDLIAKLKFFEQQGFGERLTRSQAASLLADSADSLADDVLVDAGVRRVFGGFSQRAETLAARRGELGLSPEQERSAELAITMQRVADLLVQANADRKQANADRKQQTEAIRSGGVTVGGE